MIDWLAKAHIVLGAAGVAIATFIWSALPHAGAPAGRDVGETIVVSTPPLRPAPDPVEEAVAATADAPSPPEPSKPAAAPAQASTTATTARSEAEQPPAGPAPPKGEEQGPTVPSGPVESTASPVDPARRAFRDDDEPLGEPPRLDTGALVGGDERRGGVIIDNDDDPSVAALLYDAQGYLWSPRPCLLVAVAGGGWSRANRRERRSLFGLASDSTRDDQLVGIASSCGPGTRRVRRVRDAWVPRIRALARTAEGLESVHVTARVVGDALRFEMRSTTARGSK